MKYLNFQSRLAPALIDIGQIGTEEFLHQMRCTIIWHSWIFHFLRKKIGAPLPWQTLDTNRSSRKADRYYVHINVFGHLVRYCGGGGSRINLYKSNSKHGKTVQKYYFFLRCIEGVKWSRKFEPSLKSVKVYLASLSNLHLKFQLSRLIGWRGRGGDVLWKQRT